MNSLVPHASRGNAPSAAPRRSQCHFGELFQVHPVDTPPARIADDCWLNPTRPAPLRIRPGLSVRRVYARVLLSAWFRSRGRRGWRACPFCSGCGTEGHEGNEEFEDFIPDPTLQMSPRIGERLGVPKPWNFSTG